MQNTNQYKVLVVDDDSDITELLQYNLEKEGYEVTTAENGKEALETAVKFSPHIILMDVMMPVMDGITACRQLREKPEFRETYILFLTAKSC